MTLYFLLLKLTIRSLYRMPVFLCIWKMEKNMTYKNKRVFEKFFKATFNYVINLTKNLNTFIALYIFLLKKN